MAQLSNQIQTTLHSYTMSNFWCLLSLVNKLQQKLMELFKSETMHEHSLTH